MRLKTQLILPQVWVGKMTTDPQAEDPKLIIPLTCALTHEVADAFGCREIIYAGSVPRTGVKQMNLEGGETDCTFHFSHDNMAFSGIGNIGNYIAKLEGQDPLLEFRVKLAGYAQLVTDLAEKVRVDPMEVTLKPAQMDLGLQEEQRKAEPKEEEDGPCVDCNNGIPFADGDPSRHDSGQPCAAFVTPTVQRAPEDPDPAVVTPISHRQGRRRRGATPSPEQIAADQRAAAATMPPVEDEGDNVLTEMASEASES